MSDFTARRALAMLRLDEVSRRRRELLAQLRSELAEAADIIWPPIKRKDGEDSAAFLLLFVPNAMYWGERAAAAGVTLRLCWPAYQPLEPAQHSQTVAWFAQHLVFLKVHPRMSTREVAQTTKVLRKLYRETWETSSRMAANGSRRNKPVPRRRTQRSRSHCESAMS